MPIAIVIASVMAKERKQCCLAVLLVPHIYYLGYKLLFSAMDIEGVVKLGFKKKWEQ